MVDGSRDSAAPTGYACAFEGGAGGRRRADMFARCRAEDDFAVRADIDKCLARLQFRFIKPRRQITADIGADGRHGMDGRVWRQCGNA